MYEVFEHTADFGLRIAAPTREALFAEAGRALIGCLLREGSEVRAVETQSVAVPGDSDADLLHDWLSELLYLFQVRRFVAARCEVHLTPEGLQATVAGEPLALARHEVEIEIKAITYHGLMVEHDANGWRAEVIVDI